MLHINKNNSNIDIIFFKVWRNIVINKEIFKYVDLYKKNKYVKLNGLESLSKYSEREYITTLVYTWSNEHSFELSNVHLPKYGALKEVDLTSCLSSVKQCNIIPNGVEIIHFNGDGDEIQVSELPQSVHTISNVELKKPYINNEIPKNIKSLSFTNINPNQFYDLIIPNSITKLDLSCLAFCKSKLPIAPSSFIPSSVIELKTCYDERFQLNLPKIPLSSINKLHLDIYGNCNFEKGILNNNDEYDNGCNVKELIINGSDYGGINLLDGSIPESVNKLTIYFGDQILGIENTINANSIPNNVTDLKITYKRYPTSFNGIFPNNLTKLVINSRYTSILPEKIISELPLSIKYLIIDGYEIDI